MVNYLLRFQKSFPIIFKVLKNTNFILGIYIVMATILAVQQYVGSGNNFIIFQHSVYHFFGHQNLYLEYPKEYFDIFLYSPSFPILFLPFAYFPTIVGFIIWAIFTSSVFFVAIKSLPISENSKLFIFYLIIPELNTAVSNLQTNPLIAAFTVLAWTSLEKSAYKRFSIFPALNFFIKGYGGIASIFFLLKNPNFKTFIYLCISFIIIGLLPLCFYSTEGFKTLYEQWFTCLKDYSSINVGLSVMGLIQNLIYKNASKILIQLIGMIIFLLTFIIIFFRKNYEDIKFYFLANVLIWMVIFNQVAESPTYLIASTGVFIWFVSSKKNWVDISLFCLFFILTVMSPTDLFPKYLRNNFVVPYCLKALPCVLVWLKIQFKLSGIATKTPEIIVWNRKLI